MDLCDRDRTETTCLTAPSTPMPTMVPTTIPRPPRLPSWGPERSYDADGPSSQLDVEITQTRVEPWFPLPTDDGAIVSDDGLLCVSRPRGQGWTFLRRRTTVAAVTVTAIECRRSRHTELFWMVAKDWELPGRATLGARDFARSAYDRLDEGSYSGVTERGGFVEHRGHAAYETIALAMHQSGARKRRIRRVQRVVVVGAHALVLTSEGSLRAWERYAADHQRFIESTRFAHLR